MAATEYDETGPSFKERAGVVLAGVLASATLTGVLFATGATAGSGGVGPGGGGGGGDARYERIWDDFSSANKNWARETSACESGGDRNIHGGGGSYHGAFQFMKSTWRSSPRSVGSDPHSQPWKTQAVVAVLLKKRDGAGHWPVCG